MPSQAPSRPSSPRSKRAAARGGLGPALVRALKVVALLALAAVVLGAGLFAYLAQGLPSVEALRTYRPPQGTKVLCADGSVCAEFFEERRTVVDVHQLPAHVKNAFLAAEDADFYKHEGLDFAGILRASVKNLIPGTQKSGASTITQQVVKNLLLSKEGRYKRKVREWILTPRVEEALTKDQILNLYVNFIYFGHGRHGVEEAALYYFGKHARDLTVGEAAVLGGTPQQPHRINPVTNVVRAKTRQRYVLTQMARHGFIPERVAQAELDRPIVLAPRPPEPTGAYYAEEIRRALIRAYGEDMVLRGGLRVEIAMVPALQRAAEAGVRAGLEAVDRRQGYRGPLARLEPARFAQLRPLLAQRLEEAGRRKAEAAPVADLAPLARSASPEAPADEGAEEVLPEDEEAGVSAEEALARSVPLKPLEEGLRLVGYVTQVDDRGKRAVVDLVGRTAEIPFASTTWARRKGKGAPQRMSDVVAVGDLVRVRVTKTPPAPARVEAALDQVPEVQGALVALEPASRHVVALVGGYDFALSPFNRATQARRQPGSSFKPFLYAAALASGRYTPLTQVNDAPEAIRDPYTGKQWKPQNYDRQFEGPMTLRQALTKSKNTVSVRLIEALTPAAVIDVARRAGIRSELPENLTLALGTGEVTVLEAANAYATLQTMGKFAEPLLLLRVTDPHGTVLEEHQAAAEETLPPAVAYLTTSLMRSVVEEGTATQVRELDRPAAGKTGTTSEYRDTWFSGFTADYVASAWVGFDDNTPIGPSETGGRAALPLWLNFMRVAHERLPAREFERPEGVVEVRVDPETGLLAGDALPGRLEPFLEGTQPTAVAPPPGQVAPDNFFLEAGRRGGL